MLSGIDIVVDEVHSPEDERIHTDEAKVKPCSPPKRGKLGKTRRRGWLSKVCVPAYRCACEIRTKAKLCIYTTSKFIAGVLDRLLREKILLLHQ